MKNILIPGKNIAGFTLLELLVTIFLIGILAAIAGPSWFGFLRDQKLGTLNEQVYRALLDVQSRANKESISYTIQFQNTNNVPQMSVYLKGGSATTWKNLGDTSKEIIFSVTTAKDSVTFNYEGRIDESSEIQPGDKIKVVTNPSSSSQKCAIVQTILGAMKTASDTDCN